MEKRLVKIGEAAALLVAAGAIMVAEIALLCFVPLGDPQLVFAAFLLNRVLSGSADAR